MAGLIAVGKVARIRESSARTTTETAYYLLSAPLSPERFNEVVRSHWGVENSLHWRMDVVMNEDQDRSRLGRRLPRQPDGTILKCDCPEAGGSIDTGRGVIATGLCSQAIWIKNGQP